MTACFQFNYISWCHKYRPKNYSSTISFISKLLFISEKYCTIQDINKTLDEKSVSYFQWIKTRYTKWFKKVKPKSHFVEAVRFSKDWFSDWCKYSPVGMQVWYGKNLLLQAFLKLWKLLEQNDIQLDTSSL